MADKQRSYHRTAARCCFLFQIRVYGRTTHTFPLGLTCQLALLSWFSWAGILSYTLYVVDLAVRCVSANCVPPTDETYRCIWDGANHLIFRNNCFIKCVVSTTIFSRQGEYFAGILHVLKPVTSVTQYNTPSLQWKSVIHHEGVLSPM